MTINNGTEKLTFEDDTIKSPNQVEKYKGTVGKPDRISMVYEEDGKPRVIKAWTHYIPGVGSVIATDYTRANYGEPKLRLGTVVAKYNNVDKTGRPQRALSESDIELMYFLFSPSKYAQIREATIDFPLETHDLKVSCEEEKFQRLSFTPCLEALWKMNPEIQRSVAARAKELALHLESQLGKNLTADQIREKLAEAGGPAQAEDGAALADSLADSL